MALKIRLARGGAKKRPFYRIVVAEASAPRDGRYVERVGTYNPMVPRDHQQRLTLNGERISFWMSKGAQPTERVVRFLEASGVMEKTERNNPIKAKPGKKAQDRLDEKEAAKEAAAEAEEAAKVAAAEAAAAEAAAPVAEEAPEAPVAEEPAEAPVSEEAAEENAAE